MAWLQPEPMEPIPEEGTEDAAEWTLSPTSSSGRRTTTRKREIFTSEQVDTLVRSAASPPEFCVVGRFIHLRTFAGDRSGAFVPVECIRS
ncbi:unnamed protein product [Heligmosomoides polygyrus]|uniref:SH2 domain-containing protein n=1 Tax=Heligmosomoides polygyrus TaxID=6339 RepID=A0A183F433_HELPZ|nr:unnamed protein product [Heligmosomoides polygyrus]